MKIDELKEWLCTHFLQVVDHYEKPRNVGSFDKSDKNVGTGLVGAPACGDVMKLQIKVDENGNIVDSCFKTFGCGSAIASSSVATEWYVMKPEDHVWFWRIDVLMVEPMSNSVVG